MRHRATLFLAVMAAGALALGTAAAPVLATYPGTNGRIAFTSARSGTNNIFTMKPDGTDVRQLTTLTAAEGGAEREAWSPDGSQLVFEQQDKDGSARQLYLMNADGSNQHRLFKETLFRDLFPSFSPDGGMVIFSRCRADFGGCAIYTVKTNGNGLTALTHFNTSLEVLDLRARYSPDGKTIAFDSAHRNGVLFAVYLMAPHGANLRMLTSTGLEALEPDWSPDGKTIAFAGPCCSDPHGTIWSIHSDGTGAGQLTPSTTLLQQNPRFSPRGDRIVFQSTGPNFDNASILAMDPNGNGLTTIQTDAYFPDWGVAP